MPKKIAELQPLEVRRLASVEGFHNVGGVAGLHMQVRSNSASWVLRVMVGSKRRDMGLGGYPDVTLADARDKARKARERISEGFDPVAEREKARVVLATRKTFDEAAKALIRSKGAGWRNPKHRAQWKATLDTYASPIIGKMPVELVDVDHVIAILEPICVEKHVTANRVRQRVEMVLDWAKAAKLRTGDNPARWRGHLDKLLPTPGELKKTKQVVFKHHRAMPYASLPAFLPTLRAQDGIAARALEFLILTAARSGEVRLARWPEIDLDAAVWVVPGERMKAGREHRVPLPETAMAVLRALPRFATLFDNDVGDDFVFPSPTGKAFSDMALTAVLRRMKVDAVPHGFRSTFRDWAGEETNYPSDVAEAALAHAIKDKTQAAYQRGDLFEKRRVMMDAWAAYAIPATGENVVAMRKVA